MGVRDFVLSLMKCVPKGTEPLQLPGNHNNRGLSYSEERNQILFFEIDWDIKSEINIHTLHRTEHLIAIYFKRQNCSPPPPREWGREWGLVCVKS